MQFNKLELRFAQVYKISPLQAMRILGDIYFYTDLFLKSTIDKRAPWDRVQTYLFTRYGVTLHTKALRRWYKKTLETKEVSNGDY